MAFRSYSCSLYVCLVGVHVASSRKGQPHFQAWCDSLGKVNLVKDVPYKLRAKLALCVHTSVKVAVCGISQVLIGLHQHRVVISRVVIARESR
jgi:hypothetical protein